MMNSFNLSGPEFLVFYPFFALGVAAAVRHLQMRREEKSQPRLPRMTDPYRIAFLRKGPREAVRMAVISLAERGILAVKPNGSVTVTDRAPESLEHPLEHAVLGFFRGSRPWSPVGASPGVQAATSAMRSELEAEGLLETSDRRVKRMLPAVAIPLSVVVLRVLLSGHHPHGFLFLEMVVFAVLACLITDQRLTSRGRAALEHLEALFRHARPHANDQVTQAGGAQAGQAQAGGAQAGGAQVALLLAATFGVAALSRFGAREPEWLQSSIASIQDTFDVLRAKRKDGGGCGSCGGGCGGGCGGCGGCGG